MQRSLTVSIAVVRPGVSSVTYSVPVTAVTYIELLASGQMDATGRYRYVEDIVLMVDAKSILLAKALTDSQALSDHTFKKPFKALQDSFGLSESDAFFFAKSLTDLPLALDAITLKVAKILTDAYSVSDSPAKTAAKALGDEFGLTESQTVQARKVIADSITFIETVSAVRAFLRQFSESVVPVEFIGKSITKPPFIEQVFIADARDVLPIKNLSDAVAMNDGASVGDGSTYFLFKGINNIAAVNDFKAIGLTKPASDQFTTAESGLVVAQSYSDITYFAANYVGTSSTF